MPGMRRKPIRRATSRASLVALTDAAACSRFTATKPTRVTSKSMPSNVQRIFALIFTLTAFIVEHLTHFAGESRGRIRFGQELDCCLKHSMA